MDRGYQHRRMPSLAALLASTAIVSFSGATHADDLPLESQLYCSRYADAAVTAAQLNRKYSCYPKNDARWGTNAIAHNDFCRSLKANETQSDDAFLEYEWASRDVMGDNCYYCSSGDFATASANRVLDNKLYNCGFTGPEWSDYPSERRNACLDVPDKGNPGVKPLLGKRLWWAPDRSAQREMQLQDQIYQCTSKYDPQIVSYCKDYASRAVDLALDYKGFKGDACTADQDSQNPSRWWTDWSFHFSWCIKPNSAKYRAEEQNSRAAVIGRCMKANAAPSAKDLAVHPERPNGGEGRPSSFSSFGEQSPAASIGTNHTAILHAPIGGGSNTSAGGPVLGRPATMLPPPVGFAGRPAGGIDTPKNIPASTSPAGLPVPTRPTTMPHGPTTGRIDTSKSVPASTLPPTMPIPTHPSGIPNRPTGGIDTSKSMPGPVVPATTPASTNSSGGISTSKAVPTPSVPANAPMPTHPSGAAGGISTSKSVPIPSVPANTPVPTHPIRPPIGGTSTNGPVVAVSKHQPVNLDQRSGAAAAIVPSNRIPSSGPGSLHSNNPASHTIGTRIYRPTSPR
ncbi:MAG: hypothetical protein C5B56_10680 [Proteobacteria bacterium]|nr:MAG: hypothetical protein C5B56_10680 [Pseudomonadota bacterium]